MQGSPQWVYFSALKIISLEITSSFSLALLLFLLIKNKLLSFFVTQLSAHEMCQNWEIINKTKKYSSKLGNIQQNWEVFSKTEKYSSVLSKAQSLWNFSFNPVLIFKYYFIFQLFESSCYYFKWSEFSFWYFRFHLKGSW